MLMKKVVGIEITDKVIRGVEISGTEKSHKISTVGMIDLPKGIVVEGVIVDAEQVSSKLSELWNTVGFKSKDVYYGVDNKYVLVRFADIKTDDSTNFKTALLEQVQNFLPVDQKTVELDFVPLDKEVNEEGVQVTKTLIVAAGKKMIGDSCDVFKKGGLFLEDIEVNNIVISRLLPKGVDDNKGILLINFKKEIMNLLIIKNGKPMLARNIIIDIDSELQEEDFANKYLEKIGKDIVASLTYFSSTADEYIEKVFITGYGVWNEEMISFIKETSKTNVIAINPFDRINKSGNKINIARPYEFGVAYSLAMRGLEGDK